ncbi:type I toxin-antitoxin system antitoxin YafN [Dickeya solani]|uniref:Type I toxin-antitoxin system antitoxin YafN n=2 Tax=Dickeya solani TaxID=1089444 RepID=A0AAP7E9K4_9GAMM|nr:type I toxin-antitoxin system antitoxin YafN [Dickeya solani]ANE77530.1 antitoxin of toxin-antitoxin stability system [Dickeya solani IPO 2222]AUC40861.1 Antitoxin YafN [Dickeya solani RNS 08.23.3.1.A]AUH07060.1 antitoxin of toxin-antitoxin stability system [Dickeya solani D s0432-1]AUH11112.1 antitoxin of toxin-antitoxin stability system [Dickeya solani]AYQ48144.1 Antitoxin YafN [Dickeya solani]
MERILAEKSINITELRKNPAKYFIDEPVAVLSNNRPAGYMVSAKVFEELIDLLEAKQETVHTVARFRPTAERLRALADSGQKLLNDASGKDLTEFTE